MRTTLEDIERFDRAGGSHVGLPIVYNINDEGFQYKTASGQWSTRAVKKESIANVLNDLKWDPDTIQKTLKNYEYQKVYGQTMVPWAPAICVDPETNDLRVNTWRPPKLRPATAPGPYPGLQRIMDWLITDDAGAPDLGGQRWVKHWMAAKAQNPLFLPRVAVCFATKQGGGKGTLARVLREILGMDNTMTIQGEALESRFNPGWAGRLFVLGDEVLAADTFRDISNRLKVWIDSEEIEREAKGKDRQVVRNRLAWMFASNSDTTPIMLEESDRRYTVFANHRELSAEYMAFVHGQWTLEGATPEFAQEIGNFWYELMTMEVDFKLIGRPYQNEARANLIDANRNSQAMFFRHVSDVGLEALIKESKGKEHVLLMTRGEWDFGEKGVQCQAVYRLYNYFCQQRGTQPLRENRFGNAVKNGPRWEKRRHSANGERPWVWVIPGHKGGAA